MISRILNFLGVSELQLAVYAALFIVLSSLGVYAKYVYDDRLLSLQKVTLLEQQIKITEDDIKNSKIISDMQRVLIAKQEEVIKDFDKKKNELEAELDKNSKNNNTVCIDSNIARRLRNL